MEVGRGMAKNKEMIKNYKKQQKRGGSLATLKLVLSYFVSYSFYQNLVLLNL